jgi:integrase
MKEQLVLGPAWRNDEGLVMTTTIGTPLVASNVHYKQFLPLLERAGLPRIRLHDLRHTAATLLLRANVNPKVVSEMLGHASIALTLDIYSHVLPDMQQDATVAMERVLGA